jgi:MoaA/NifB/PqqE/SkfB family radical SAM enzyme
MDGGTWERVRLGLRLARHVHLQGWGEPLLHPGIRDMAAAAREAGCSTGITTNGDTLADAVAWLLAEQVSLVCVSVGGASPSHGLLRGGSDLADVWRAVRRLTEARPRRHRLRVEIGYLLSRDNAPDLAGIVRTAAAAGVDAVYVTHLDVRPARELEALAAFGPAALRPGVASAIQAAERAARESGLTLRLPAMQPNDMLICSANPLRILFVCRDGRTVPCVCLGLPAAGPIERFNSDGVSTVQPLSYGNLGDRSWAEVLDGAERTRFNAPFVARLAAEQRFLARIASHGGPDALRDLDEADRQRSADLAEAPWPAACQGCPKSAGW